MYQVGGSVNGLKGTGLVLQNNQSDKLSIESNTFSFSSLGGISYDVSVLTQPTNPNQLCTVENGSGSVSFTNRSDIVVDCRNTYIISGTVEGLVSSGLELQNSNGDRVSVTSAGFSFPSAVFNQLEYTITVRTQPIGQTCLIAEKTVLIEGADYSVSITCTTSTYTVAGSINNLNDPSGVTLQLDGQQDQTITGNTTFAFNQVPQGSNYTITVSRQPDTQACSVVQSTSTLLDQDITDIDVTCFPATILDIVAKPRSAFLQWNNTGASAYNLYYSSTQGFALENYANFPNGTVINLPGSASSHTEVSLQNGVSYYFVLETLYTNGHKILTVDKGVRPNAYVTNGAVNTITTDAQGTVYIGGDFTKVAMASGSLISVNPQTGEPNPPNYPIFAGDVNALIADGAGGWIAGGAFSKVGNVQVSNLVHILADGSIDQNWAPNPDFAVHALAKSNGNVYVGGAFRNIGGLGIEKLAKVSLNEGIVDPNWSPSTGILSSSNNIFNTLIIDKNTLYVGGKFTKLDGQNIRSLAAFDIRSNKLISTWMPNPSLNTTSAGTINALASHGNSLYVAGDFSIIDNQNISSLAVLGTIETAGNVDTSWIPIPDGAITALHVNNNTLYSAGSFINIGGQAINSIATFDLTGAIPILETQWLPVLSGSINSITTDTQSVYLGGDFTLSGEITKKK